MLMGAARNALWAFNARVSLTCLYVVAHGLPRPLCGQVWIARSQEGGHCAPAVWLDTEQNVSVCLMLRRRPPTGLSLSRCGALCGKGNAQCPIPGSVQVKIQDGDNQLRFQPAAQFFIHIGMRAAVNIIACPRGKRGYVTGIVADYRIYRIRLSPDSGGDNRVRKQGRPCACRFKHPHHLPSAPSAADRLSACGR